jgi:hypothetical protein
MKVEFFSWIDTLLKYYSMHSMSNLNKFQNSYQVLEKNLGLCLLINKGSRIHKECLKKKIWPKILPINTLGIDVHKMYGCDKNQVPCCNIKKFKK